MADNEIVETSRQVIQNKLLTALESDRGLVAALFSQNDLEALIDALDRATTGEVRALPPIFKKQNELYNSLNQLKEVAFGKDSDHG